MQFVSSNAASRPGLPRMSMNFNLQRERMQSQPQPQPINTYTRSPSLTLADTTSTPPKMEWGAAIWIFFHTLAFKVRDADFAVVRTPLFNFIKGIATTLPCPKCSEHAKAYLSSINFSVITNKRDLILMLYAFHNAVNTRKHVRLESAEDMDALYARANTTAVVRYFINVFLAKNGNPRLLTDDMQRQLIATKFERWFADNSTKFEP